MAPIGSISVSSTINSAPFLQKAAALATKLQLPCLSSLAERSSEVVLAYTPQGLQLLHLPIGARQSVCLLYVDFVNGKNGFRLAQNCTIKQPMARAAGIKPGLRPSIFDGTAGLASDAFVLACLGCRVTICERSPIIGALLEDGLDRAAKNDKTADIVGERIRLVLADSREYLQQSTCHFDTVYLDPMYPHRKLSALNKQSLRVIRALVGADQDAPALLETALEKAVNRVVVKRPRQAPPLSAIRPSHEIVMKNSRFDIYLTFKTSSPPVTYDTVLPP